MVRSPVVSSMRSRQTGHVGSSRRFGGGGANGLLDMLVLVLSVDVKGSFVLCGKVDAAPTSESGLKNSTLLMKTTWQFSGSAALKSLPLYAFCHSRALFDDLNFIRTIYLFALPVLMRRKCETSSRAWSPTKPSRSEGIIHEGTASTHTVVQSSWLKLFCSPLPRLFLGTLFSSRVKLSSVSRYRCTTPHPTSVIFVSDGRYTAFVCRPPFAALFALASMSMLSISTAS